MALQDILDEIKKTASAEIEKLTAARDHALAEIKKEYSEKRDHRKVDMEKKVQENATRIKERARTFAKMETRNSILRAKRAVLGEIFEETVKKLMESEKYSDMVAQLLKKAGTEFKTGTVVPPKGKEKETQKALEAAGTNFELSKNSADIRGGFILLADRIEVNFSFESILAQELWNELEVELNQLLFTR